VSDTRNHTIRKVTSAGLVTTVAGTGAQGFKDGTGNQAAFHNPISIVFDSAGNFYVVDNANRKIRKVTIH
jgi:hypothetical protein